MQRKNFRYFLMKDAATYYYVAGGDVLTSTTPIPLAFPPIEWKETDLRWKRNDKYHGVFRSFVVPLGFPEDGATILRQVYYTQGAEGKCILKIERLNHTTQIYESYYVGDIDFSQTLDTFNYFQAAVLDRGLAAIIKAKESTQYEIPILNADCLNILMDGVTLRGSVHYVVPSQGDSIGSGGTGPITLSNTPIIAKVNAEGVSEPTITDITFQHYPAALDLAHGTIYTSKYAETVTLQANCRVEMSTPSASGTPNLTFAIIATVGPLGGSVINHYMYYGQMMIAPGQTGTFNIKPQDSTLTVSLNAGDSIGIFFVMTDNPTVVGGFSHINSRYKVIGEDNWLDIYTEYRRPATSARWLRQIQLLEKLVDKMGDGQYSVTSNYLTNPNARYADNNPWNTLLTCGDAIRGLGDGSANPAKIKIALEDLIQDGISRDMTSLGVEGDTVRWERLDYFYQNNVIIANLGEVKDLQVSPAKDYLWNTLKIGYNYKDQDKLNGKDDPFLTHQYASAGIRVKAERNAVSPFVASIVMQEYVRANLGGKKTTDSDSDNDTFLAEISGAMNGPFGLYTLARQQNNTGGGISGILAGSTAYNLSLTPKRNLMRNAPLIHTALHLLDGTQLTFQTADQNAELISKLGTSASVTEKADVAVSSLDAPLFLPIIFEFQTQVPVDMAAMIDANPYGKILFLWKGQQYGGFIMETGIKPADNAVYTYKLLAAPDTDLSKLIR